jgi:hypothetical protein
LPIGLHDPVQAFRRVANPLPDAILPHVPSEDHDALYVTGGSMIDGKQTPPGEWNII